MPRRLSFIALASVALTVLGGCIPLPYATPPLRIGATSGVATGRAVEHDSGRLTDVTSAAVTTMRLGVNPLQLSPETYKPLDVGIGYVADVEDQLTPSPRLGYMQGAYVESSFWPMLLGFGDRSSLRLGPTITLDVLFAHGARDVGVGALVGAALELSTYCDSPVDSTSVSGGGGIRRTQVIGVATGESAIAVTVQGGLRWVGAQRYWMALLGVSGRLPASAGFLVLWLI